MADRSREHAPQSASSTIPPTLAPRRQRPRPSRGISPVAIIIVAVVALVGVAGLIVGGEALRAASLGSPSSASSTSSPAGTDATTPATSGTSPVLREGNTKGTKDAPVEIVEYADFQCPFCAQAARGPLKQVEEAFVQTGQARIVFRHFPFIGNESLSAALAAECAGDQNKFWEYHDKLFASQQGENKGAFARDKLKGFAGDLGLDRAAFDSCLDNSKHLDKVKNDFAEGQRAGVQSTPTFMVNDQKLLGARPFAEFQKIVEQELQKQR